MMWDVVLDAWVAMMEADATWVALVGAGRIFPAQSARPVMVPSVEYMVIDDSEEELFNPIVVQVDYWIKGNSNAAALERRLRERTHRDTARELGGYRMWTQLINSSGRIYATDKGVTHRSIDFLFKPLRSKYAESVQS